MNIKEIKRQTQMSDKRGRPGGQPPPHPEGRGYFRKLAGLLMLLWPLCLFMILVAPSVTEQLQSWGLFAPYLDGRYGESGGEVADFFAPEVLFWENRIAEWGRLHDINPNLVATVMQIESCGHPGVASHAGAQGLFQVMPFHFSSGEVMIDPETNALRGMGVLSDCLEKTGGNAGLAMACYNGGPGVLNRARHHWPAETQRYYGWGTAIYRDALDDKIGSGALDEWMAAGGEHLCARAAQAQQQLPD
jgi:hypothetical protein